MPTPQIWRFTQLAGPKKTLTLTGASAPHGRPRHGAVVSDEKKLRESETFYAGNRVPSRHVFGDRQEPFVLKGRWMDTELGPNGANRTALEWQQFLADAQPIAVHWGSILGVSGLLTGVRCDREGESDIAYELTIKIDEDEALERRPRLDSGPSPRQFAETLSIELELWLAQLPTDGIKPDLLGAFGALRDDVLEGLDTLVSAVNTPAATLLSLTESLTSFDEAVAGDLKRVRGAASQMQTAVLALRDTVDSNANDIVWARSADSDIAWRTYKADADVSTTEILALLADLDRQAEIAERGQTTTTVTATDGDSWESLSVRAYGGPDGAGALRDANGARYGERPVAGRTYSVPKG